MWKSYLAHYKNKYPQCQVTFSDTAFDVYSVGEHGLMHLVSLSKNGAGQIVDVSEEHGCYEKHDLSPIPKESRVYKLYKDGKVGPSEEYKERKEWRERNAIKNELGYSVVPNEQEWEIKKQLKANEAASKREADLREREAALKSIAE